MWTGAAEPLWTDVAGFWVGVVVAAGTVGAVIVSLALASRSGKQERAAVTRVGAIDLLDVLAEVHRVLPHVRPARSTYVFAGDGRDPEWEEANRALKRVTHAQHAVVPLMVPAVQSRWGDLRMLLNELATASPVSQNAATGDPAEWTKVNLGRAREDVEAYIGYVRETLTAIVDGRRLPPDVKRPHLRRAAVENVWEPPK